MVIKKTHTRESKPVEGGFLDTDGPFPESFIWNRYWIGMVENCSSYSGSFFIQTKSQLPNKIEEFFKKITSGGTPIKYLRCVNAGERQSKL